MGNDKNEEYRDLLGEFNEIERKKSMEKKAKEMAAKDPSRTFEEIMERFKNRESKNKDPKHKGSKKEHQHRGSDDGRKGKESKKEKNQYGEKKKGGSRWLDSDSLESKGAR